MVDKPLIGLVSMGRYVRGGRLTYHDTGISLNSLQMPGKSKTDFPKWWWCKMVLYHGAIRKKSPETNPSKRVPKLVCQIHDKAIYCSWWLQPISLNILKHIVQIGPTISANIGIRVK